MTHPLRKAAQGQPCTLRLPGCRGDTEHTVLAHFYVGPDKSCNSKGPDWFGADSCDLCHSALDGYKVTDRYWIMLRALQETLQNRFDRGLIVVSGRERQKCEQPIPKRLSRFAYLERGK